MVGSNRSHNSGSVGLSSISSPKFQLDGAHGSPVQAYRSVCSWDSFPQFKVKNLRVSGGGRKRAEEREGEEGGEEGEEEEGGMGMVTQCIVTGRGRTTDFAQRTHWSGGKGRVARICTCTRG